MRLLFEMDAKNYNPNGKAFIRPSVRGIIIRDNQIAMIHSIKYDYYKFPGGGIEPGETHLEALRRETLEEAGLVIIQKTVREYGYVHRIQKGDLGDTFIQDNYYYLCEAEYEVRLQALDAYEADEQFTLEWIDPVKAIEVNRNGNHGPKDSNMLEREARVLEYLIAENII